MLASLGRRRLRSFLWVTLYFCARRHRYRYLFMIQLSISQASCYGSPVVILTVARCKSARPPTSRRPHSHRSIVAPPPATLSPQSETQLTSDSISVQNEQGCLFRPANDPVQNTLVRRPVDPATSFRSSMLHVPVSPLRTSRIEPGISRALVGDHIRAAAGCG